MLKPAILYKEQIVRRMKEYFYTDDMLYTTGCLSNWIPDISDCPDDGNFQYAIVDNDNQLIGFLLYSVNWYSSKVYDFGLFSFDRTNPLVGKDLFSKMEELIRHFRRVEWRAVSGNPACRSYDHFVEKHGGNKHILKDSIRDSQGNYHDDIIYEIINKENK